MIDQTASFSSAKLDIPKVNDLRAAAEGLEAQFLAEMLKSAGLGETQGAFAGGIGEEQFASFLRQEQAQAFARSGGIGLAEAIFDSLVLRMKNAK